MNPVVLEVKIETENVTAPVAGLLMPINVMVKALKFKNAILLTVVSIRKYFKYYIIIMVETKTFRLSSFL